MTSEIDLLDRIRGCFMGVAIGDALGMPVETMSPSRIFRATGGLGVTDYLDPIQTRIEDTSRLRRGSMTDDTQLTLAVSRSLVRCKGFDLHDQGIELVREFQRSTFSWGRNTQRAAAEFVQHIISNGRVGRDPNALSAPPEKSTASCGNGVAMRIAPLACLFRPAPGESIDPFLTNTMALGLQTHGDPRASFAAIAVGMAIALGLEVPDLAKCPDAAGCIERRVTHAVRIAEYRYKDFRPNDDRLSDRLDHMWLTIDCKDRLRRTAKTGCFALESVPFSIGTFARHPSDFSSGVLEAVNAGGDADTTASMVGGMIGANVGLAGIPPHFVKGLRDSISVQRAADRLFQIIASS